MNNRLEQFIAAENISKAEFADNIGVARASVSHILNGRNNPSYDFIMGVMQRYPRLNMEWLLAGKGKMYKEPVTAPVQAPSDPPTEGSTREMPEVPDLFSVPEEAPTTPRESQICAPSPVPSADTASTQGEQEDEGKVQSVENQRKITKIVVFYDDNTYQELS